MTMKTFLRSRRLRLPLLALLLIGGLLALWAFVIEPGRLVVRQYVLPIPALPPLRIAALSDLHVGAPHISLAKLRQIVATTNAAQPDLSRALRAIRPVSDAPAHAFQTGTARWNILRSAHAPSGRRAER